MLRVARGERLEVTDHGRPVAILAPLGPAENSLDRLISAGRVRPPTSDLLALLPPTGNVTTRMSDALQEERADRL